MHYSVLPTGHCERHRWSRDCFDCGSHSVGRTVDDESHLNLALKLRSNGSESKWKTGQSYFPTHSSAYLFCSDFNFRHLEGDNRNRWSLNRDWEVSNPMGLGCPATWHVPCDRWPRNGSMDAGGLIDFLDCTWTMRLLATRLCDCSMSQTSQWDAVLVACSSFDSGDIPSKSQHWFVFEWFCETPSLLLCHGYCLGRSTCGNGSLEFRACSRCWDRPPLRWCSFGISR